jgi:hypothetical protein
LEIEVLLDAPDESSFCWIAFIKEVFCLLDRTFQGAMLIWQFFPGIKKLKQ